MLEAKLRRSPQANLSRTQDDLHEVVFLIRARKHQRCNPEGETATRMQCPDEILAELNPTHTTSTSYAYSVSSVHLVQTAENKPIPTDDAPLTRAITSRD